VIVSDLLIRHYFVIHRPAPEQHARACLDYEQEHEHDDSSHIYAS
jgi:hypothetical protein